MVKAEEGLVVNRILNEEEGEIRICGIEGEVTDMFSKSLL